MAGFAESMLFMTFSCMGIAFIQACVAFWAVFKWLVFFVFFVWFGVFAVSIAHVDYSLLISSELTHT